VVSNESMRRIRWTDLPEDPAMLSGWQLPSLVLATLFFNFFFWYVPATTFPFIGSPILYLASLGTVIALVAVFFFLCPALAAHRTRKSLFQLAEASFGVVPAIGFRIGCVMLCMLWLAGTTGVLFNNVLRFVLQRSLTLVEVSLFLGLPVVFLFVTGLQNLRTSAKLAFFTNKLGAALLIAAALRVRPYLPDAWSDLGNTLPGSDIWTRIAEPLMVICPLALLAANFGTRTRSRKDVTFIGLFGLAIPMAATLFAVSLIQRAAYHWRSDLGGLANIALALWGGDSGHYQFQWIALAMVTLFGIARFCTRMWRAAVAPIMGSLRLRLAVLAATLILVVALSTSESMIITRGVEIAARVTGSIAAVLTADFILTRWRFARARRVDWLSLVSVGVGLIAGGPLTFWEGADYQYHLTASILLPYAASFVSRVIGLLVLLRVERRASVNTSKPAINDHFKTGQRSRTQDMKLF